MIPPSTSELPAVAQFDPMAWITANPEYRKLLKKALSKDRISLAHSDPALALQLAAMFNELSTSATGTRLDTLKAYLTQTPITSEFTAKLALGKALGSTDRPIKKITINDVLSDSEKLHCTNAYPLFRINFTDNGSNAGHQFSRATRTLARAYAMHLLRYDARVCPLNKNAHIIDIGGNALHHLSSPYVHTCAPELEVIDPARHASQVYDAVHMNTIDLANDAAGSIIESNRIKLLNNDPLRICARRGEHCNITASGLLSLHSAYNIPPKVFCKAMLSHDCEKGVIVLHYSPEMLTENEGTLTSGMQWRRFISATTGTQYIEFFFTQRNDIQNGYLHEYDEYISYVTTFVQKVRFNTTRYVRGDAKIYHFTFQPHAVILDTIFIEVFRTAGGSEPSGPVFRVLATPQFDKKTVILSYRYNTVLQAKNLNYESLTKTPTALDHLSRVRLIIDTELYNKVYSFAINLKDNNFNLWTIHTALSSWDAQEIVDGQSRVHKSNRHSPEQRLQLACAIYVITYIDRYEATKMTSALTGHEEQIRALNNASGITRFLHNLVTPPTDADPWPKIATVENSCEIRIEDDGYIHSLFSKFTRLIASMFECPRTYQVMALHRQTSVITLRKYIDIVQTTRKKFINTVIDPAPQFDEDLIDAVWAAEAQHAPEPEAPVAIAPTVKFSDGIVHQCVQPMLPRDINAVPGHCVFATIVALGLDDSEFSEIRTELAMKCRQVYGQCQLTETLELPFEAATLEWPGTDIFPLIAATYGVTLCVHHGRKHLRFGQGEIVHCQYDASHVRPLFPATALRPLKHHFGLSDDPRDRFEEPCPDPGNHIVAEARRDQLWQLMRAPPEPEPEIDENGDEFVPVAVATAHANALRTHERLLADARASVYPLQFLSESVAPGAPRTGYACRSAYKTAEICHRYQITPTTVLSIGAPGGEIQYFTDRNVSCYGVSLLRTTDEIPAYETIDPGAQYLLGNDFTGDILNIDNVMHNTAVIRADHANGIDLVCCDAAQSRAEMPIDLDLNDRLFRAQALQTVSVLRARRGDTAGGNAYFKIFNTSTDTAVTTIIELSRCFARLEFPRLETTRPTSTERHVICLDFLGVDDETFTAAANINDFHGDVRAGMIRDYLIGIQATYDTEQLQWLATMCANYKLLSSRKSIRRAVPDQDTKALYVRILKRRDERPNVVGAKSTEPHPTAFFYQSTVQSVLGYASRRSREYIHCEPQQSALPAKIDYELYDRAIKANCDFNDTDDEIIRFVSLPVSEPTNNTTGDPPPRLTGGEGQIVARPPRPPDDQR